MASRKIYNEVIVIWNEDTNSYDTIYEDSYSHEGDVYEMMAKKEELSFEEFRSATQLLKDNYGF